jgi:hypothetical protein
MARPINFAHNFNCLCKIGPKAYQLGQDEAFARDQVGLLLGCIDAVVVILSTNAEAMLEVMLNGTGHGIFHVDKNCGCLIS